MKFLNRSLYFCLKIIWWNIRLLVLIEEDRELLTGLILQCVTDLFCHCSFSCLIMSFNVTFEHEELVYWRKLHYECSN